MAANIPGARFIELGGDDHLPFIGDNAGEIVGHIVEFLTGAPARSKSSAFLRQC